MSNAAWWSYFWQQFSYQVVGLGCVIGMIFVGLAAFAWVGRRK